MARACSQFHIGGMYAAGQGTAKDAGQALAWYRRSAELGFPEAMQALARAYEQGLLGLARDAGQAAYWQQRARGAAR